MLDFLFFVKTLGMTVLICIFLQFKVGGESIESHAVEFIETSSITQPLQEVAEGGVKVVRRSLSWVSKQVNIRLKSMRNGSGSEAAGERTLGVGVERSESYRQKHDKRDADNAAAQ